MELLSLCHFPSYTNVHIFWMKNYFQSCSQPNAHVREITNELVHLARLEELIVYPTCVKTYAPLYRPKASLRNSNGHIDELKYRFEVSMVLHCTRQNGKPVDFMKNTLEGIANSMVLHFRLFESSVCYLKKRGNHSWLN